MVIIDGNSLSAEDLISVSRHYTRVVLSHKSVKKLKSDHSSGDKKNSDHIPSDRSGYVSGEKNMGIGDTLPLDIIRSTLLLKANELARGLSGIRERTIRCLLDLLNRRVHPAIPALCPVGLYGESGYLAYLTELLEHGSESDLQVIVQEEHDKGTPPAVMSAKTAWKTFELEQCKLEKYERFALSTGNGMNIGAATLLLSDCDSLISFSEVASAMSVEAYRANRQYFHKKVQGIRGERGQSHTAKIIRNLTAESQLVRKARQNDPYSFSCIPQTTGALRTMVSMIRNAFNSDLNAMTVGRAMIYDLKKGSMLFNTGNFHPFTTCLMIDFLKEGMAAIGVLSEKRISNLIHPDSESGLPSGLAGGADDRQGFSMCLSLAGGWVSENRIFAQPAILDSTVTYGGENDFSPQCLQSALDGLKIFRNVKKILAAEFHAAYRAIDFRVEGLHYDAAGREKKTEPRQPGTGVSKIYELIRSKIPRAHGDGLISEDIEAMVRLMASRAFAGTLKSLQ